MLRRLTVLDSRLALKNSRDALSEALSAEAIQRNLARPLSKSMPQLGVLRKNVDLGGEAVYVQYAAHQARVSVVDHVRQGPCIRHDDGPPSQHGLNDRDADSLAVAGLNIDVHDAEQLSGIGP